MLQIQNRGSIDDYMSECQQCRLLQWRSKSLYGEYLKKLDQGGDIGVSFQWLERGLLKVPTETQIIAVQDQALTV